MIVLAFLFFYFCKFCIFTFDLFGVHESVLKNTVFWEVIIWRLTEISFCFGATCCFCLEGDETVTRCNIDKFNYVCGYFRWRRTMFGISGTIQPPTPVTVPVFPEGHLNEWMTEYYMCVWERHILYPHEICILVEKDCFKKQKQLSLFENKFYFLITRTSTFV
jgi:hypothetical protein